MQKTIPVKIIPRIKGGGIKESSGGVNSSMIYSVYTKNLCNCHNVPPPSTTIKVRKIVFYLESHFPILNLMNKIIMGHISKKNNKKVLMEFTH
jgi:hypothetical protein